MERLAIKGGKPVRENFALPPFPGGMLIGEDEKRAVMEVLESQSLFRYHGGSGPGKVAEFEHAFSAKIGAKHAVAVCSGTAALHTALAAMGLTCGDEVLLPAFYYVATAHAVIATGALPVFVEVDDSLTMDTDGLRAKISERTKAIIPVHMRGVPSNMETIMKIAEEFDLLVLEDCAQSAGATFQGKRIGTFGHAGAFSLQYYKVLTTGDGGVVVTDDDHLYEMAVRFQNNGIFPGSDRKDAVIGLNLRMPELSGAVAGQQVKKLDRILAMTRERKSKLKAMLESVIKQYPISFRRLHDPKGEVGISLVMFVPEDKGECFSKALTAEGIANWWLYDSAGHSYHTSYQLLNKRTLNPKQFPFSCDCNRHIDYFDGMCPKTDSLLKQSIHFDVSPFASDEDLNLIVKGVEKVSYWVLGKN